MVTMNATPTISVVMPCYNAASTIALALEALARQNWPGSWELVIADNGSSDNSVEIARQFQDRIPGLRVVDASDAPGSSHAYNSGAAAAHGQFVLFCDADDAVADDWLAAMARALETHAVVGGSFEAELLNPGWVSGTRELPQQQGLQAGFAPLHLPHIGSGNMGIDREVFQRIGGFREYLPVFGDTDLSWRLQLQGYQLYFAADAVLHVRLRDTMLGIYRQARSYGEAEVRLNVEHGGLREPATFKQLSRVFVLGWGTALLALLRVHNRASFGRFMWKFGWRVGRAHGWLAYGPSSGFKSEGAISQQGLSTAR
jgi:glycosyltransferase involved in cell wall biosynthesis